MTAPIPTHPLVPGRPSTWAMDALIFAAGLALFYSVLAIARTWLGPIEPAAPVSQSPWALPGYAAASLLRITVAYGLSLAFALVYGYVAAYNPRAERIMIPLLDILQSIPVLSFLPGVMLAMVALFPSRQLGVELGAIVLIFTGQAWNMVFSFYASLKSIPRELRDAARVARFGRWQRFTQLELPYAAIGLIWNSMMSVAGGWFFLMACEMFVLGERDFRLPGLGSYLQTAAGAGDVVAIWWGIGTLIGVIVALDQLVWRPVIAWADKFKLEQVESAGAPRSPILDVLRRSRAVADVRRFVLAPLGERLTRWSSRAQERAPVVGASPVWRAWAWRIIEGGLVLAAGYALVQTAILMAELTTGELGEIARGAAATTLRVIAALLIGAAWTIPVGVAIGLNPKLARVAQPLAQIAASVPATALFPVVLLALISVGGGLNVASVTLMLLGTQWYILFNVIAGAMALPTDLKEVGRVFRFGVIDRWRLLILPGIFPSLVTGLVTAAGGAWNASIVAEYFRFKGQTLSTSGLGAIISQATDSGNFDQLLAATILMAAIVVTTNRLVWRPLFRIAQTRYKMET